MPQNCRHNSMIDYCAPAIEFESTGHCHVHASPWSCPQQLASIPKYVLNICTSRGNSTVEKPQPIVSYTYSKNLQVEALEVPRGNSTDP